MVMDIEVVCLLVYVVVVDKDVGCNFDQFLVMVKLFVLVVVMKYIVEVVQIYGGYGYVKEYYVE